MKLLAMVLVFVSALCVRASTTYDVTADWAKVSSAGYADGTDDLTTANGWNNSDGVATVSNKIIKVDTEEQDGELTYTPAEPTSTYDRQTVEISVPSVVAGGVPSDLTGAQAALAVVTDGTTMNWYGWCEGGWTKLSGATPQADTAYGVRAELDTRNSTRKVRYSVKANGASDYTELGGGWLDAASSTATSLTSVSAKGKTALTDIKLTQTGTMTASDTMTERMSKQGVTESQLNETAENGNRKWENIALGLSCTDETAKPVVLPVQSSDASTVTLKLGGVDVDTTSATVTYTVTVSDTVGGEGDTTDPVDYDENVSVTLPSSGVKYYRMNVTTTPN